MSIMLGCTIICTIVIEFSINLSNFNSEEFVI